MLGEVECLTENKDVIDDSKNDSGTVSYTFLWRLYPVVLKKKKKKP